ncbi:MAG: hypothetical protein AAGJ94_10310, partial [Pseudomonadota bacterium]
WRFCCTSPRPMKSAFQISKRSKASPRGRVGSDASLVKGVEHMIARATPASSRKVAAEGTMERLKAPWADGHLPSSMSHRSYRKVTVFSVGWVGNR